jgi:phospholipid/cholesterol/gamma-HCH transport system substrate-binding protein
MGERLVETLIGAIVLIVAGAFFYYAYTRSNVHTVSGYALSARFGSVGSLAVGSDVRVSGIKVGTVTHEDLDPQTYLATVQMSIDPKVQIPDDSAVRIAQDGLLGGNYLVIEPGGSDDMLRPGSTIAHSQGAVDLLSLVGQAIFSAGGKGGGGGEHAVPPSPGAADPLAAPGLGMPGLDQPTPNPPAEAKPDGAAPENGAQPTPSGPASDQGPAAGQQARPPPPSAGAPAHS